MSVGRLDSGAGRFTALLAILFIAAMSATAQVKARQGGPAEEHFTSPMLLDVPFLIPASDEIQQYENGFRSVRDDLTRCVCDNVYIQSVSTIWKKPKKDETQVRMTIVVWTREGHDKLVHVQMQFLDRDSKPIGRQFFIQRIDAEEARYSSGYVDTTFPTDRLGEEGVVLSLRVAVRDD